MPEMIATATLLDRLAWLYLNQPDDSLIHTLNDAFPELRLREGDLDAVRQDYNDLFCVPVSGRYLPPFESAQRAQRLWGPITHHVTDWYLHTGFNPAELHTSAIWQMQIAPDHIGYELAFYGALLAADSPLAADFYQTHLFTWVPNYARQLIEKAATPVYRLLGELTLQALNDDA
ncbi:MAG: TorD/DmsD family molecular chaperone [Chloroflexota bacterium]